MLLPRRQFVVAAASLLAAGNVQAEPKASPGFPLGFSLYGMKSLSIVEGIAACAKIGYECTELPLLADWPGDSAKLSDAELHTIRKASEQHKLPIVALMENLPLLAADDVHRTNLKRLQRAAEIARVLSPAEPPLIETILGSNIPWEEAKDAMRARLREWAAVVEKARVRLCIKAHVSNTLRTPEQLAWLLDAVKSDYLSAAFDYSHFQLQGQTLKEAFAPLAKQTAFIHVKDAQGEPGKIQFLLPGEGTIDYADYFRLLTRHGYRGPVVVEVSGQLHSRPNYDPLAAASQCWKVLSAARTAAQ